MRAFRGFGIAVLLGGAMWGMAIVGFLALAPHLGDAQGTGWHTATNHEHGDTPPAWVTSSAYAPFTQSRQVHAGYKGFAMPLGGGIQGYLVVHILSTAQARSTQWHDYQLWVREPDGVVSYWAGGLVGDAMNFGNPTVLLADANGQLPKPLPRPSMSQDNGPYPGQQVMKFAETWITVPSSTVFDLEWYLLGENEEMVTDANGVVIPGAVGPFHGYGIKRGMNFNLFPSRFPGPGAVSVSPTLAGRCGPVGPNCNFRYRDLTNLRDYSAPGLVVPN